jgi:dihydrofolate reductase
MGKVVFDISMSLDGYITAANRTAEEPLGGGGERLHAWAFGGTAQDREILESGVASSGAVITGRRNYEDSVPWWGSDGPTGPARLPVFVLAHQVPAQVPEGGVYTFVATGIEDALTQAQTVSGDRVVCVMGGATVGRAYLDAGLVDELSIHLVPVLFGSGTRLFEDVEARLTQLENISAVQTPQATHLRFRIPQP